MRAKALASPCASPSNRAPDVAEEDEPEPREAACEADAEGSKDTTGGGRRRTRAALLAFKSEPSTYGWERFVRDGRTFWSGVRNYQARNLLRDEVQVGDGVLFYHSNADPTAIVGVAKVVRGGYPDPTQFDPASPYHDPASDPAAPRWFVVDVEPVVALPRPLAVTPDGAIEREWIRGGRRASC